MSEMVNVLKNVENLEVGNQLNGYSKVRIFAGQDEDGNDIIYEAGNDTGKTLEMKNEFGSQQMAQNVLNRIMGFAYQPYEATNVNIDPSVELGDGVAINGIYSGVYIRATKYGSLVRSNLQAPVEDEIEHEFTLDSPSDRQYTRFVQATKASLRITNNAIEAEVEAREASENTIRATLSVHASDISAKVSRTGGSNSSFGWTLTDNGWSVYSNSSEVFKIDSSGATVKGRITATSGFIGSESNGFTITSGAIYNNISTYGANVNRGVYIGTNGIQLGNGFKVDSSGNLTAASGTFSGNVYAGNIQYGGSYGTMSGSGISGGTITTTQTSGGINTSLGYANYSDDVFSRGTYCNYMYTRNFRCSGVINASTLYVDNLVVNSSGDNYYTAQWKGKSVVTRISFDKSSISYSRISSVTSSGGNVTSVSFSNSTAEVYTGSTITTETMYYLGRG